MQLEEEIKIRDKQIEALTKRIETLQKGSGDVEQYNKV
jgi:prefoldin subunit 5